MTLVEGVGGVVLNVGLGTRTEMIPCPCPPTSAGGIKTEFANALGSTLLVVLRCLGGLLTSMLLLLELGVLFGLSAATAPLLDIRGPMFSVDCGNVPREGERDREGCDESGRGGFGDSDASEEVESEEYAVCDVGVEVAGVRFLASATFPGTAFAVLPPLGLPNVFSSAPFAYTNLTPLPGSANPCSCPCARGGGGPGGGAIIIPGAGLGALIASA